MFHELFSIQRCIQGCSTRTQCHVLDFRHFLFVDIQSIQDNTIVGHATTKIERSSNGFWLFRQFLECPVRKGFWRQFDFLIRCYLLATQVQGPAIRVQNTDFSILHADEILSVSVESGCFRCNKCPIIGDSNHQRTTIAGYYQLIGCVRADNDQSPGAITSGQCLFRGLLEADFVLLPFVVILSNQLGNDLRICLRREYVPLFLQFPSQLVCVG
mmetsp:Transcript_31024/g.51659  ORF Transcript_31024/g.51659 Transcript_31024/m.51659 type:complete len:214 (-) Transcript_31024:686-1327(-)